MVKNTHGTDMKTKQDSRYKMSSSSSAFHLKKLLSFRLSFTQNVENQEQLVLSAVHFPVHPQKEENLIGPNPQTKGMNFQWILKH